MKVDWIGARNKWQLTTTVRYTDDVREIPGVKAERRVAGDDPSRAVWTVPATFSSAYQISVLFPDAEWSPQAKRKRKGLGVERRERVAAKANLRPLNDRLSPAQAQGVNWLLSGSGLMADDMGSGKTVMASVALDRMASLGWAESVLILCTQSTLHVWEDHLREWTDIEPHIFHGPQRAKVLAAFHESEHPARALITTHALARKHSRLAGFGHIPAERDDKELNVPWSVAIVDEAHKMGMDPTNVGARALHAISQTCHWRWALTGTPISDSPDDLWIAMRFVDEDVLGPRSGFRQRYCIMRNNGFAMENAGFHPDTLDELHKIVDPYILRRMKREVHENLPVPLEPEFIRLDLTAGQAKVYNKLVKDGIAGLPKGQFALAIDDLGLHRLCEYTAQGVPVMRDDDPTRVDHLVGPSNKVDFVLDHLESNHRPVVLYSFSSKVAAMMSAALEKAGVPHGMIHGGTPASDRRAQIKAFQANKLRAMIITDAAAEGVTLTAADTVIFIMESWHAPTNQQVRDRIDRFGQDQRPRTIVLISAGTVDESRRLAVTKKINVQQSFLKDKAEVASFLTGTWEV